MKKSLADSIEKYIKVLIARSETGQIKIQRSELAETFACAPSQVTYVFGTRFTPKEGYLTESRRGGQGYVCITRINTEYERFTNDKVLQFLEELTRENLLNEWEKEMLKNVVLNTGDDLPPEYKIRVNQGIVAALRNFLKNQTGI